MPILEVFPQNPDDRIMQQMASELRSGEVIICPTDTLYGFVCMLSNRSGIEKICKLVGKKPEKANLSIICSDLKHISDFTLQFDKNTYKLMNRNLPGPFTFILKANSKVPKLFLSNRKTIGIRVPNHKVPLKLVELCGEPLVSASVHNPLSPDQFMDDPNEMDKAYKQNVHWTIDAGIGGLIGSAVIDCSSETPEIVREGPKEII
ncbi:MAG: threonylcarbamoyl-AMP synthase [Bacteroidia bacterium]|nr:threonylcarbamoyl-AMP synthase [Bacteroidia bacterium]